MEIRMEIDEQLVKEVAKEAKRCRFEDKYNVFYFRYNKKKKIWRLEWK